MEAKEFGEKRIIEFMSKESEYGEDERARLRDCRRLPGRGLFKRDPEKKIKERENKQNTSHAF